MKKDISLLIVKPECVNKLSNICLDINRRGYLILEKYKKTNFSQVVRSIYRKDFPEEILEVFSRGYSESDFGENYYILVVSHAKGDTIRRLIDDVGSSRGYFLSPDNSLRSKYGLKKTFRDEKSGFEVVFNGFHKIDSMEEFLSCIEYLDLGKRRSIMKYICSRKQRKKHDSLKA